MYRYRVGDAPGGGGEIIFLQSQQFHKLFLTAHTDQEKVDARVSFLCTYSSWHFLLTCGVQDTSTGNAKRYKISCKKKAHNRTVGKMTKLY